MDNLNPDEPIPQSPHVTLRGLCTWTYVLQYLLCILWIVRTLNLSTSSAVCISNFEYVYRVMLTEQLVRKSKVRIWRSM